MTEAVDHQPALAPARPAYGTRGAVVGPHHLATQAGLAMLRAGGNAVDAAIATNAALAVVSAHSCGLGGDAFWLIWDGGRLHGLNGSGRSGAGATIEAARSAGLEEIPLRGPWTVTVPGAVRSWGDAHSRFGRLPWADLFRPAIELAEAFPASPGWRRAVERAAKLFGTDGDWARTFRPHDRAWRAGERVSLPRLAQTLRRLAADGPDDYYAGNLAARHASYLGERGAPLTGADLAAHHSDWTEPIAVDYRGARATSHAPNSSGAVALELLTILAALEPPPHDAFDGRGCHDPRWVHLGLEAARLAFADRDAFLTDPEAMAPGTLERMLDPAYGVQQAARLDPTRVVGTPAYVPAGGGTVYLATADAEGMAVSLIESNYAGFGSGLVDPETGVGFQNRGAFFRLDPGHPNALAPRKRTMHTLAPGMLFREGRPWVVHGAMGGELQPQIFAQLVSALVDGGSDVATAVAAPRWAAEVVRHAGPATRTVLEPRFVLEVAAGLRARGHRVESAAPFDSAMGHAHAIELVRDAAAPEAAPTFAAATDPRSEGAPAVW
ncbi:MAG TPA: gamma-glutamyltransferase family protein [Candidatus Limnocylindrales bacterium]|nr:gamma-glutamyltransferase family protein [Candidatus Limnocylindrales bacterium]